MNPNDMEIHITTEPDADMVRRLDRLAAAERASARAGFEDRIIAATLPRTGGLRLVGDPSPRRAVPRPGAWRLFTPMRAAAVLALAGAIVAVFAARRPGAAPSVLAMREPAAKSPADDWLLVSSVLEEGATSTEMKNLLSDTSQLSTRFNESSDWFLAEGSM